MMHEPWVKGGWKFATDARILVAVPASDPDTKFEPSFRPPSGAISILAPVLGRDGLNWLPLPKFADCAKCGNTGHLSEDHSDEIRVPCECYVVLGGRLIATKYFTLIEKLPDVRWLVVNSNHEGMVFFNFGELGNCFGAVMPLSDGLRLSERKLVMA